MEIDINQIRSVLTCSVAMHQLNFDTHINTDYPPNNHNWFTPTLYDFTLTTWIVR